MYATVADVERLEAHRTFTPNSKPSKDDVVSYLEGCALELDAAAYGLGYSVPLDPTANPQAFGLFKRWCALGANAQVQQAAAESKRKTEALQAWQSAVKALRDGKYELPDAGRAGTTELKLRVVGGNASPFFFTDMEL